MELLKILLDFSNINSFFLFITFSLQCLGIHKIHNFPFPTSPSLDVIEKSEKSLHQLKLLESLKDDSGIEILVANDLGKNCSKLSIEPKYAKCILEALKISQKVAHCVIIIVSSLSVREIFANVIFKTNLINFIGVLKILNFKDSSKRTFQTQFSPQNPHQKQLGDLMTYLNIYGMCYHDKSTINKFLIRKIAIDDIKKLRKALIEKSNHYFFKLFY